MRNVYLAALAMLLATSGVRAQWTQTNGPVGAAFTSLVYHDGAVTAAVGGGVYRYSLAGSSWERISSMPLATIQRRASGAWIGSGFDRVTHFHSTDEGHTWSRMSAFGMLTSGDTKLYMNFADSLFTSTDDGASWEFRGMIPWSSVSSMAADSTTLLATPGLSTELLRSTDDGHTWDTIAPSFARPDDPITHLFSSHGRIFAVAGRIHATSDQGRTWQIMSTPLPFSDTYWVEFDGRTLVAGTATGIYRLTDSAWKPLDLPNGELPHTFDAQGNMIVGLFSGLYRVAWDSSVGARMERRATLVATNVTGMGTLGNAMLVSTGNAVYRSTNRGTSWELSMPEISISGLLSHGRAAFAVNEQRLYRSLDSGATWEPADSAFLETNHVITGAGSDDEALYISMGSQYGEHGSTPRWESGGVFRTTDYGNTWSEASGGLPMSEVSVPVTRLMVNGKTLMINTVDGLFRSTNGGRSWQPVNRGLPPHDSLEGSTFFALNSRSYLLTASSPVPLLFVFDDRSGAWRPEPIAIPAMSALSWSVSGLMGADDRVYMRLVTTFEDATLTMTYAFDGTSWTDASTTFPREVGPTCLLRNGDDLFLGTAGAGVWRTSSRLSNVGVPGSGTAPMFTAVPNPTTGDATIEFTTSRPSDVTVTLVNTIGETVAEMLNEPVEAGTHRRTIHTRELAPGLYIARLQADGVQRTCLLIKQ